MNPVVYVDFTGIYEKYGMYRSEGQIISCADIPGTDKYCDAEARNAIKDRLARWQVGPCGIHFIDNGNYHYMSRLWTEDICEPYGLVVLDNHTDMQPPAFGDILSCGSWLLEVLREDRNLQKVVLVGPSPERLEEIRGVLEEYGRGRVKLIPQGAWDQGEPSDVSPEQDSPLHTWLDKDLPLYISVDLDVLRTEDFYSNWDQGTMSRETCLFLIQSIVREHRIIGADVCGGPERSEVESGLSEAVLAQNSEIGEAIMRILDYWEA